MNSILIATHLLNGLLMIAMPIILGFYLARRFSVGWRIWWIGAVTFVLSQVGHIPFNAAVSLLFERGILPKPTVVNPVVFSAVFAGLSAGVWEECFRYGAFRWWAQDARSWSKALMLGSGWGGSEAIILGLLVLINYAIMVVAQFSDLSSVLPASQLSLLNEQLAAYWSLPWYLTLAGALERAFAITVQISLSVMVLQVFNRRNIAWLFLAIGWHALIDTLAVYLIRTSGIFATEVVIGLTAIISVILIFVLHQPEAASQKLETTTSPPRTSTSIRSHEDLSPERLEESKYD
jgi:uncharacterized membrane protein YhfC